MFITESLPVNREAEHVLLQKRKGTGELRVVLHLFQERLLGWNLALRRHWVFLTEGHRGSRGGWESMIRSKGLQ